MQINIINLFQGKHCLAGEMIQTGKKMKESWSETLWNEEMRRCEVLDIAEKMKKDRSRRY